MPYASKKDANAAVEKPEWSPGEPDIAAAVVRQFYKPSQWAVVPNASWGLGIAEADIVAVSEGGVMHEVEIKTSATDLKRDAAKHRWKLPPQSDFYYIAVPRKLEAQALERAAQVGGGVYVVDAPEGTLAIGHCVRVLKAKPLRECDRVNNQKRLRHKIWRLCALRYWDIVYRKLHF